MCALRTRLFRYRSIAISWDCSLHIMDEMTCSERFGLDTGIVRAMVGGPGLTSSNAIAARDRSHRPPCGDTDDCCVRGAHLVTCRAFTCAFSVANAVVTWLLFVTIHLRPWTGEHGATCVSPAKQCEKHIVCQAVMAMSQPNIHLMLCVGLLGSNQTTTALW